MHAGDREAVEQVNSDKAARQALVYVGWDLYEGGDHALFSEMWHTIVDPPEDLRAAFKAILGSQNAPGFVNLRRGSGLCGMDGKCEAEGVPVVVCCSHLGRLFQVGGSSKIINYFV